MSDKDGSGDSGGGGGGGDSGSSVGEAGPPPEAANDNVAVSQAANDNVAVSGRANENVAVTQAANDNVAVSGRANENVAVSEAANDNVATGSAANDNAAAAGAANDNVAASQAANVDGPVADAATSDGTVSQAANDNIANQTGDDLPSGRYGDWKTTDTLKPRGAPGDNLTLTPRPTTDLSRSDEAPDHARDGGLAEDAKELETSAEQVGEELGELEAENALSETERDALGAKEHALESAAEQEQSEAQNIEAHESKPENVHISEPASDAVAQLVAESPTNSDAGEDDANALENEGAGNDNGIDSESKYERDSAEDETGQAGDLDVVPGEPGPAMDLEDETDGASSLDESTSEESGGDDFFEGAELEAANDNVEIPEAANDNFELTPELRDLAEAHLTESGEAVIGKYFGDSNKGQSDLLSYETFGKVGDASYFSMPQETWNQLTPQEQQAANNHFIDTIAERGDSVYVSIPLDKVESGTALSNEVARLSQWGYRPVGPNRLEKTR